VPQRCERRTSGSPRYQRDQRYHRRSTARKPSLRAVDLSGGGVRSDQIRDQASSQVSRRVSSWWRRIETTGPDWDRIGAARRRWPGRKPGDPTWSASHDRHRSIFETHREDGGIALRWWSHVRDRAASRSCYATEISSGPPARTSLKASAGRSSCGDRLGSARIRDGVQLALIAGRRGPALRWRVLGVDDRFTTVRSRHCETSHNPRHCGYWRCSQRVRFCRHLSSCKDSRAPSRCSVYRPGRRIWCPWSLVPASYRQCRHP